MHHTSIVLADSLDNKSDNWFLLVTDETDNIFFFQCKQGISKLLLLNSASFKITLFCFLFEIIVQVAVLDPVCVHFISEVPLNKNIYVKHHE